MNGEWVEDEEGQWWKGKSVILVLRTRCGSIRDDITWNGKPPKYFHVSLFNDGPVYLLDSAVSISHSLDVRTFNLERINERLLMAFYKESF